MSRLKNGERRVLFLKSAATNWDQTEGCFSYKNRKISNRPTFVWFHVSSQLELIHLLPNRLNILSKPASATDIPLPKITGLRPFPSWIYNRALTLQAGVISRA